MLLWVGASDTLPLGTGRGCVGAAGVTAARGAAAAAQGGASTLLSLLSLLVPGVLLGLCSNPARPRGSASSPVTLTMLPRGNGGRKKRGAAAAAAGGGRLQPCCKRAGVNLAELGEARWPRRAAGGTPGAEVWELIGKGGRQNGSRYQKWPAASWDALLQAS